MIMYHLGPQLGVWIMQVSTFSSVLINRFHCSYGISIDSQSTKESLLAISFLAASTAFFTANSTEQLIHIGGSPLAMHK